MSEAPSVGYVMAPSNYAPPVGSPQVDLWLADAPTDRFFDVHTLRVQPLDSADQDRFTIGPHEVITPDQQLPAGRIVLAAHDGDLAQLFSFGCIVNAQQEGPFLHCTLTSSAPIFDVPADAQEAARILVDDLTALAARHCAEESAARQAKDEVAGPIKPVDPYLLFLSALVALTQENAAPPASPPSDAQDTKRQALDALIASVRAKDGWPENVPTFAGLLTGMT
jgi:hypothetical protein